MEVLTYIRKCISCLNKIVIVVTAGKYISEAPCPHCKSLVRIWP